MARDPRQAALVGNRHQRVRDVRQSLSVVEQFTHRVQPQAEHLETPWVLNLPVPFSTTSTAQRIFKITLTSHRVFINP